MVGKLSELGEEAQSHADQERWGQYRNVRYETAQHVLSQGDAERAGYLYIEVLIFDLQGVTGSEADAGFSRTHRGPTPSVAREVARFSLREGMDEEAFKAVYDRVASRFWIDAFPRSKADVWEEVKEVVWEYRELIQLEKKVDALGGDQLLSEEEAKRYAEVKDDYDLLRRVESLLEEEPMKGVPREKRNRVHRYLSEVDVERLADRWQEKSFRWAGQILLSNGEAEWALKYFEQALTVGVEEGQEEIEELVEALRREVGSSEEMENVE